MSSTSNIQTLLTNVFRPTVAYDPSTGYVPKVNLCNIDAISAKSLTVTTFGLGDSNGNIFIGSNAGGTSSNTNNTVLGYAAGSGMANTTGVVYIGNTSGIGAQGASNVISIGKEARGAGTSNIYIGSGAGSSNASSANNILIGHGLDYSNQILSNTLQIGKPGSLVIQGNLANKQVGINTAPAYALDVCGDFSFHNSNGSFTYALDSSGDTQIDFRSSNVGKKAIMNIVGDVYGQSFYGTFSGSITTPTVTMGNGSITAPSYTFSNDTSTGFYYSSAPAFLGVTAKGCNSMVVNTTGVGIGTSNISTPLDVSGITRTVNIIAGNPSNSTALGAVELGGGYNADGAAANRSTPAVSFQYGASTSGGYRHFIRSRHDGTVNSSGNAIDFFTNQSASATGSTAPGTSNVLAMSVTSAGVGIGKSNPSTALDVSGTTLSSNVRVGSGTVSAPSYVFSTDTSLGLYRVGANQLGFASAGVNRMTISGERVGIGTTTPTFALDVCGSPGSNSAGAARVTNTLMITNKPSGGTTPISGIRFFSDTSAQYFQYGSDISGSGTGTASLNFTPLASTTPILTLASNQNVGIGTSNPGYMLDVVKTGTGVSSDIRILAGTTGASSTNTASTIYQIKGAGGGDVTTAFKMDLQTVGGYGVSVLNSNNTPYVRFDSTSNRLGIGTTAPAYTLDISAVSDPGIVLRHSTAASTIRLVGGGVADGAGAGMQIFHTSNDQGIYNSNTNPFSIWTSNARRLTILSNGRVGLGTTAPAAVLDVSAANDPGIIVRAPGTQAGITLLGYGTTNGLNVYNRDTDQGLFTNNTLPLVFWTNSNIRMTISGERVGIGNRAPSYTLDVCGTARIANTLFISDSSSTTTGGIRLRTSTTTQFFQWGPNISSGVSDAQGVKLIFSGINLSGTYMTIDQTNSNVGIGTTVPNYRLDVSTAPTTASVNMSTWSRTPSSNCLVLKGGSGLTTVGNSLYYPTTVSTIDSNIVTYSNTTSNGLGFRIQKSGIYSFAFNVYHNSAAYTEIALDASTNDISSSGTTSYRVFFTQQTSNVTTFNASSISYTTYLSSNNSMYYRPRLLYNGLTSDNNLKTQMFFSLTFLQEMPNLGSNFPY